MPPRYEVIGIEGIGEIQPGDDIAAIVVDAAARQRTPLTSGDVVVLSQKIVSKSEGRLLRLPEIIPSPMAMVATGACWPSEASSSRPGLFSLTYSLAILLVPTACMGATLPVLG